MQARLCLKSDIVSINKWLERWGHPLATSEQLPARGYIVPGVAAGFIRDCETGMGMIDSYVSNSLVSSASRNKALNIITEKLLSEPFTHFITMTANDGLVKRFLEHGMIAAPQYLWLVKGGS